jgi:hypothetical protein
LLEILRPPEGYSLDFAIGTTFSLDLLALLTVPIGVTLFEAECESGAYDPVAVIESLRRYAGKICIFCHAGRIRVPQVYGQPLCTFIEQSVFQALPPKNGAIFHPKVWALRYTTPNGPIAYRLLCLSRNLTHDKSWDTALVLDGTLANRGNAFTSNRPIGDFIASLPGMVKEDLPEQLKSKIDLMQQEIRRVTFDLPPGFDSITFHALGIEGHNANPLFGRMDRMLIVSPFLSEDRLDNIASLSRENILVSRLESLEKIPPECLRKFTEVFCLKEGIVPEEDSSILSAPGETQMEVDEEQTTNWDSLDGLHAKLYIADSGSDGRIWTGSANATDAAFSRNVEFLVELRGKKKDCGINAVLNEGKDGKDSGLKTILDHPFSITYKPDREEDCELMRYLADRFGEARDTLVDASLTAHVSQEDNGLFTILVEGETAIISKEISVMLRPITLPKARAITISTDPKVYAEFRALLDTEITAFFAFDVTIRSGGRHLLDRFVLKLPLEGAPLDRNERILRAMLKDKNQVLRLMLLILSLSDPRSVPVEEIDVIEILTEWSGGRGIPGIMPGSHSYIIPLFECMVRAMAKDPRRLDDLKNFVEDFRSHPETSDLLPDGIDEIWEPIWKAREMMRDDDDE